MQNYEFLDYFGKNPIIIVILMPTNNQKSSISTVIMSKKVDVSIAFYGKPYNTIVAIRSLLKHSGQHIDKIFIARERIQPHDDYVGIFKIIDYFRDDSSVKLEVFFPKYFVPVGVGDYIRTQNDTAFRQSIMFQHALETTDKKYLIVMHNDMLYYGDIIGKMLELVDNNPQNIMGVGSVGQCWSCPAGPDWANRCDSTRFEQYVPSQEEAIEVARAHATPRRELQIKVLESGRVHLLPECRLNEYCALIDVSKYRKETLPTGDLGCYGGSWGGVDLGTVWSHEIYKRGYKFINIKLEDYAQHSPFDESKSGTKAKSHAETYWISERNAEKYINENFGPIQFSNYVKRAHNYDTFKRKAWLSIIHTYGFIKTLVGIDKKQ